MPTTTGTYEGKTLQVTWGIVSPYTATATDELIQGYGGADTIYGNTLDNYIFGDQRGDRSDFDLTADGADVLYGFGGNDTIDPGAGFGNWVNGGVGTDTLDYRFATPGEALLIDMPHNTASAGSYGSTSFFSIENINGSLGGSNRIYGDEIGNLIRGGNFQDRIKGNGGDDMIFGLRGDDVLRGGRGADTLYGNKGDDKLLGGKGFDLLVGGNGGDELDGGKGDDRLNGLKGHDVLHGRSGNDTLIGRSGRDELAGGAGTDVLTGGGDADKFIFYNSSGSDVIMDFESKDTISIGSGAKFYFQIQFNDTDTGLWVEFGNVEIFLVGLDIGDIDRGNFEFF